MKAKSFFKRCAAEALESIYPNKCMSCGRLIDEDKRLCVLCDHYFERIDYRKRCKTCGLEKENCRCDNIVYRFETLIAPFYNTGLAKRAFYSYKLTSREHYASFFADGIIKAVRLEYAHLNFDAVCCVPASKQRIRQFGFNPAEQLASAVAEALDVPFLPDALVCIKKKSGQHNRGRIARFQSVRNAYRAGMPLKYKRVLLIDDISSTGATLDECARQLLLGGIEHVNCAAALITDRKDISLSKYTAWVLRQAGIPIKKSEKQGENNGN